MIGHEPRTIRPDDGHAEVASNGKQFLFFLFASLILLAETRGQDHDGLCALAAELFERSGHQSGGDRYDTQLGRTGDVAYRCIRREPQHGTAGVYNIDAPFVVMFDDVGKDGTPRLALTFTASDDDNALRPEKGIVCFCGILCVHG